MGLPCLNLVFALNEAARKLPRAEVPKADVTVRGSKERNAGPDKDWNAGDDQPLNEAGTQEALYSDTAVDVGVLYAICTELVNDVRRLS